jgi:shikimate dehydrogenase
VDSLRAEGVDVAGRRCAVLGAGGAARAIVRALARAGAAEVTVVNRTAGRAEAAAPLAGDRGRVGAPADVAGAEIVVNSTSVGMLGDPGLPVDPAHLRPGQVVADIVYRPERTPLLVAAEAAGARPIGGLGMLIHQAAHAFRHWTGAPAPIDVMTEAARRALARDATSP